MALVAGNSMRKVKYLRNVGIFKKLSVVSFRSRARYELNLKRGEIRTCQLSKTLGSVRIFYCEFTGCGEYQECSGGAVVTKSVCHRTFWRQQDLAIRLTEEALWVGEPARRLHCSHGNR